MKLDWQDIKPYSCLPEDESSLTEMNRWAGVYIWGFRDDANLFWPYYVGKHSYITYRLCQHLSSIKGGFYTIFESAELFKIGRKWAYKANEIRDWIEFINKRAIAEQELHVQNMIDRFHYTWALVSDYKEWGGDCEKTILNTIREDILINKRGGTPSKDVDVGNLFKKIDPRWRKIPRV